MKILLCFISALISCLPVLAQNTDQGDSLVVLMSSQSAQIVDIQGASYRKVIGPARFLHNNTYLLCDTAYWNVDAKFIEAWGNVSILQEETVLTSDRLTYYIDQDLAQFRGSLVQLEDKDHNVLRTRNLDYNTKDSVAIFRRGGSMRDKDGQIIESDNGTYDSKIKTFTFKEDVNMFTDSIFVKTKSLVYESQLNKATFGYGTNAWQQNNMLSSSAGWYDRAREVFLFHNKVHVMSEDQEGWCDSLYFHRMTTEVEMLGKAQVSDTTRNVFALAGNIQYVDSLSKVTLTREPAVISQTEEQDGSVDTVYLGADKLVYYTLKMYEVDSLELLDSKARLENIAIDPVGEYRRLAAEKAAKEAEEAAMNDPNHRAKVEAEQRKAESLAMPKMETPGSSGSADIEEPSLPAMDVQSDSLALSDTTAASDSLAATDSLAVEPLDTTKIGFLEALRNVRIYKKNMQVVCDSLVYTDLDSLARLYVDPLVWQDSVRQYAADSITVVVSNANMEKASLMSNAFITIKEDAILYDQIRGAEMTAFFDGKGGLTRFDALGGASALFYIEENGALATVNKTDSKMLSASFKDSELERISYYEAPKNDGYPVVQLSDDEKQMKGFNWKPERRPVDRKAVTKLSLRPSERSRYSKISQPEFVQTNIYFPGYIGDIRTQIAVRDSLRKVRERERAIQEQLAADRERMDSVRLADSLSLADSQKPLLKTDSLAVKDSVIAKIDSLVVSDSLEVKDSVSALDIKAKKKADREAEKLKKQKEREDRWAELDKRDEEKAKAKEEKKKEKERKRKRKALKDMARQAEKDAIVLDKYKARFEKKKAAEDARKTKKKEVTRKDEGVSDVPAQTEQKVEGQQKSRKSGLRRLAPDMTPETQNVVLPDPVDNAKVK